MTQKEFNFIKDSFSQIIDDIAGNPDWGKASEAVASDLGTLERKLEKKISSLPSNLDEAAEEALDDVDANWQIDERGDGCTEPGYNQKQMMIMFKAGAGWMAGQGVTKEAVMGMATEEIFINVSQQTLNELCLCPGDKVVVQIRKK